MWRLLLLSVVSLCVCRASVSAQDEEISGLSILDLLPAAQEEWMLEHEQPPPPPPPPKKKKKNKKWNNGAKDMG